jgi:hypothetical protein
MQKQKISHGRKNKQKHLPQNDTELHGNKNKQKQKINTESKHISTWVDEWLQSPWTAFHGSIVLNDEK